MSKKVEFYSLHTQDRNKLDHWVCEKIESLYLAHRKIFVLCEDKAATLRIDDALWSFKADSFIAHNLQGEAPSPPPPVQIGCNAQNTSFNDILINLSTHLPEQYHRYRLIISIVPNDESHKAALRNHFRFYRRHGYQIHHYENNQ